MANFGARLAYPAPERISAPRRQATAAPPARAEHASRPPSAGLIARVTGALRRLTRVWVEAQVRVAGPPWDDGWPAPDTYGAPAGPPAAARVRSQSLNQ